MYFVLLVCVVGVLGIMPFCDMCSLRYSLSGSIVVSSCRCCVCVMHASCCSSYAVFCVV